MLHTKILLVIGILALSASSIHALDIAGIINVRAPAVEINNFSPRPKDGFDIAQNCKRHGESCSSNSECCGLMVCRRKSSLNYVCKNLDEFSE